MGPGCRQEPWGRASTEILVALHRDAVQGLR